MSTRFPYAFLLLAAITQFAMQCNAARILAVFPSPSKSHLLIHLSVAEALAKDDHNVTVIATIPNVYKKAKYSYIHVDGPLFNDAFARKMVNKPAPVYKKFASTVRQVLQMANVTMNNHKMLDFLGTHKAGDFDVLILGYFMNDFMLGLGAHFKCPIVVSFMVQPIFSINTMLGNPVEGSYVPTLFTGFKQPMNFWQRVHNFMATAFEHQVFATIMSWEDRKMYSLCSSRELLSQTMYHGHQFKDGSQISNIRRRMLLWVIKKTLI